MALTPALDLYLLAQCWDLFYCYYILIILLTSVSVDVYEGSVSSEQWLDLHVCDTKLYNQEITVCLSRAWRMNYWAMDSFPFHSHIIQKPENSKFSNGKCFSGGDVVVCDVCTCLQHELCHVNQAYNWLMIVMWFTWYDSGCRFTVSTSHMTKLNHVNWA